MRLAIAVLTIGCGTKPAPVAESKPLANHATQSTSEQELPPTFPCSAAIVEGQACADPWATCSIEGATEGVIFCGVAVAGYQCREGKWHRIPVACR